MSAIPPTVMVYKTDLLSRFACAVCENWLHYGCLFEPGTTPPIGEDDFDVLVCSQCLKSDRNGVKKLMNGWAGVAGKGVLLVGDSVEGALEVEAETDLSTKRSLDDDSNDVKLKKPRLEIAASISSPIASSSRLPSCIAPSVSEISPLDKIIAAGKPANVFLQEDFMERWCRCSAVRQAPFRGCATRIDRDHHSVHSVVRQTSLPSGRRRDVRTP